MTCHIGEYYGTGDPCECGTQECGYCGTILGDDTLRKALMVLWRVPADRVAALAQRLIEADARTVTPWLTTNGLPHASEQAQSAGGFESRSPADASDLDR